MILDLLFGKKRYVKTQKLGTFDARIRKETAKEKTWCSTFEIENYSEEVCVILEGDTKGPFKKHIENATRVIENLDKTDSQIKEMIKKSDKQREIFIDTNLDDLKLEAIISLDSDTYELMYCIDLHSDDEKSIGATYKNNQIITIY
jgi:hypothetical protein